MSVLIGSNMNPYYVIGSCKFFLSLVYNVKEDLRENTYHQTVTFGKIFGKNFRNFLWSNGKVFESLSGHVFICTCNSRPGRLESIQSIGRDNFRMESTNFENSRISRKRNRLYRGIPQFWKIIFRIFTVPFDFWLEIPKFLIERKAPHDLRHVWNLRICCRFPVVVVNLAAHLCAISGLLILVRV